MAAVPTATLTDEQLSNFSSKLRDSQLNWFQNIKAERLSQQINLHGQTSSFLLCSLQRIHNQYNHSREKNSILNGENVTESEEELSSIQPIGDENSYHQKTSATEESKDHCRPALSWTTQVKMPILHRHPDIGTTTEKVAT